MGEEKIAALRGNVAHNKAGELRRKRKVVSRLKGRVAKCLFCKPRGHVIY